jgi:hypothetical protein
MVIKLGNCLAGRQNRTRHVIRAGQSEAEKPGCQAREGPGKQGRVMPGDKGRDCEARETW